VEKPLGSSENGEPSTLFHVKCSDLLLSNWEDSMLDDDGPPKTAEYQDGDVTVLSRAPLMGTLELMGDDDEPIELQLDRECAENLMSVLTIFLLKGEGEDAPNAIAPSEH
jgi:hypothetical protein